MLPDGSLATQRTDGRDKVIIGNPYEMTLDDLHSHEHFDLKEHGEKWIAATLEWQPFHANVDPSLWDPVCALDRAAPGSGL